MSVRIRPFSLNSAAAKFGEAEPGMCRYGMTVAVSEQSYSSRFGSRIAISTAESERQSRRLCSLSGVREHDETPEPALSGRTRGGPSPTRAHCVIRSSTPSFATTELVSRSSRGRRGGRARLEVPRAGTSRCDLRSISRNEISPFIYLLSPFRDRSICVITRTLSVDSRLESGIRDLRLRAAVLHHREPRRSWCLGLADD